MNERDQLMDQVAAATTMLRRTRGMKRKNELDAFMAIFHPEVFKDRNKMAKLHQAQVSPDENL